MEQAKNSTGKTRSLIKRVFVDDDVTRHIAIAGDMSGDENYSSHDRHVAALASMQWLIKNMSTSSQFTVEQQAALKELNARVDSYRKGE